MLQVRKDGRDINAHAYILYESTVINGVIRKTKNPLSPKTTNVAPVYHIQIKAHNLLDYKDDKYT